MAYADKRISEAKGSKGKVSWRARYKRPDGTWGSEPGFATRKTAEAWGEEQEAAIRAGRWIDPELARKHFGVFAREFMKARNPRGNTVTTRWRMLETVILPKWEHTPLIAFNWFDVEAWANAHPAHETEIDHSVSLMSTILTAAVDAKHLTVNPLYGRRRSVSTGNSAAKAKKTASATSAKAKRAATPEAVLQLAQRLGPTRGLHVLTVGFVGLRWGESNALHRETALGIRREAFGRGEWTCQVLHIDPDFGELVEYDDRDEDGKRIGTVLQLEPPKNAWSVRDVDLPPFLAQLIRAHRDDLPPMQPATDEGPAKYTHLYATDSGTFWRRGNWSKVLRPAVNGRPGSLRRPGTAGVEPWAPIMPGLTMDLLRHTHDTFQEQIGVKAPLAYEQAGHKRPGIKAVYQHPTVEMRIERLAGLEEIYERAMRNLGWESLWGRVDLLKWRSEDDHPNIAQMITFPAGRKPKAKVRKVGNG